MDQKSTTIVHKSNYPNPKTQNVAKQAQPADYKITKKSQLKDLMFQSNYIESALSKNHRTLPNSNYFKAT